MKNKTMRNRQTQKKKLNTDKGYWKNRQMER